MRYFGSMNELSDKNIIIKSFVNAELVSCGDNSITVNFPEQDKDFKSAVAIALVDYHNKYVWYQSLDSVEDTMTFTFDDFDFTRYDVTLVKYKTYLVFEEEDTLVFSRLYCRDVKLKYKETNDFTLLYYDVIKEQDKYMEEYDKYSSYSLLANITSNGFFGFLVTRKERKLQYKFRNFITDFYITEEGFYFNFKVNKYAGASKISLKFVSHYQDDKMNNIYFDIDPIETEEYEDHYIYKCFFTRDFLDVTYGEILDFVSVYTIGDVDYLMNFDFETREFAEEAKNICLNDNYIEHPKLTDLFTRVQGMKRIQILTYLPASVQDRSIIPTLKDYILAPNVVPNRSLMCSFDVDDGFVLNIGNDISGIKDLTFYMYNKNSNVRIIVDYQVIGKRTFKLDLSNFKNIVKEYTAKSYMLCSAFEYEGTFYCTRLNNISYNKNLVDPTEFKSYVPDFTKEVASFEYNGVETAIVPIYNKFGYIYLRFSDRKVLTKLYVTVPYRKFRVNQEGLFLSVDITDAEYNFKGFALCYRYKQIEDKREYYIEGTKVKRGRKTYLEGLFDLSKYDIKRIIWDVFVVFEAGGHDYFSSIKLTPKQVYRQLYRPTNFIRHNDYRFQTEEGTDTFLPYFTTKNTLAFMVREEGEMDSRFFKFKELTALFINKLFHHFYRRKIILTYEKFCNCAQDNGFAFFKNCMENGAEKKLGAKIYYVIDKDAPDYERVKKYKNNVIDFCSFKHMLYLLASRLLVSSDGKNHVYAWRPNCSPILKKVNKKKIVFLQHGVIALKRVDFLYGKGKSNDVNMFVTSSSDEFKIITKNFGYSPKNVCITGLARWDDLEDKSQNSKEILLMPTWRSWLDEVTDAEFVKSDYYKNYMEFLQSDRLTDILNNNDLTLNFYIHPKFKDYIENFNIKSDRIKIIPYGELPLNELMMRCKLLITDYSSVCWDVFYMNKPVLFYQFDYDMYNQIHGSYINMETDLFGDRSTTLEGLFDEFEKAIREKFVLPEKYSQMRESSFAFIDKNNTSRIVNVIKDMKW